MVTVVVTDSSIVVEDWFYFRKCADNMKNRSAEIKLIIFSHAANLPYGSNLVGPK